MSDSASLERRRESRAPIVIPVELGDARGFSLYSTSDLSVGGAFFDRAIPHPVGAEVKVTLRPPGSPAIECRGVVVNVPDRSQFGMGVRFEDLSDSGRGQLASFIHAQEQQS